jgi:hypothetical protein
MAKADSAVEMALGTPIEEGLLVFGKEVSILSDLIRNSYRDVARPFGLTPKNCLKHPSSCTDDWFRNDIVSQNQDD